MNILYLTLTRSVEFLLREESSAMRMIHALANNTHPYANDGESFFSSTMEEIVRIDQNNDSLCQIQQFARINNNNQKRFEYQLNRNYQEVVEILGNVSLASKLFSKTMFLLGFSQTDYYISGNNIEVLDFSGFSHCACAFSQMMCGALSYTKYS